VLMTWFAICWRWLLPVPGMAAPGPAGFEPAPPPVTASKATRPAPAHVAAPAPPWAAATHPGGTAA